MDFWWALVDNFIYFIPSYWKFKPNSNISECWPHVMHKFLASQGSMTQLVNSIIALPLIRVKTEKESFVPRVQTTMSIIILCIKYIHLHFYLRLTYCEKRFCIYLIYEIPYSGTIKKNNDCFTLWCSYSWHNY